MIYTWLGFQLVSDGSRVIVPMVPELINVIYQEGVILKLKNVEMDEPLEIEKRTLRVMNNHQAIDWMNEV